jgi:hypothetical protein
MGNRLPGTATLKVRAHSRALEGSTPPHPPAYPPVVEKKAGGESLSIGKERIGNRWAARSRP